MTNHTETNSTDQLTGGTVANEGGATSPTVRTEIKAGNPGLVFQHSEAKGLKKSLAKTFAIAIAIATVGMVTIPVQSAQAAPGDGISENCKKTGSNSRGEIWTCTNILGWKECTVWTGASPHYWCTRGEESRRDDIFGNPYDERDPAARHLLKLVQRDTRR